MALRRCLAAGLPFRGRPRAYGPRSGRHQCQFPCRCRRYRPRRGISDIRRVVMCCGIHIPATNVPTCAPSGRFIPCPSAAPGPRQHPVRTRSAGRVGPRASCTSGRRSSQAARGTHGWSASDRPLPHRPGSRCRWRRGPGHRPCCRPEDVTNARDRWHALWARAPRPRARAEERAERQTRRQAERRSASPPRRHRSGRS